MFIKNRLGIYLTPKKVNLVEVKGKKINKNYSVSFEEEPKDKKIESFLKEIKTRHVFIGLSSEDLIIRSFLIPIVPSKQIPKVIDFEVRKYIPFPIQQLIYDFQYRVDKLTKKIKVIFIGIKKEVFKEYDSIFRKVGFKVLSLEPGVFSILRLLKQKGKINNENSFGLIDIDTEESNFTVIQKGFPFFTLPIKIPLKEKDIHFKLLSEIKISLDYFYRQFADKGRKDIVKIFLLSEEQFTLPLKEFEENLGTRVEFLAPKDFTVKDKRLSMGELKAFSLGLPSLDKKINLYKPTALIEKPIEVIPQKIILRAVFLRLIISLLIIGSLIVFLLFSGWQKSLPLKKELSERENRISSLKISSFYNTLSDLQNIYIKYQKKLENLNEETEKLKSKLTPLLNSLPQIIPEGVWLEEISLTKEGLILKGLCYYGDKEKESDVIYKFLSSLRENNIFTQKFKEIDLISMGRREKRNLTLTDFEISAK